MKEPLPILKPSVKTMVGNFHNIGTMRWGYLFLGEWDYTWRTISLFNVEACEHFNLSSRMGSNLSHLAEVSEFLTRATSSNFWGLACPGHCGPPFGVLCCWLLGVCFFPAAWTSPHPLDLRGFLLHPCLPGLSPIFH